MTATACPRRCAPEPPDPHPLSPMLRTTVSARSHIRRAGLAVDDMRLPVAASRIVHACQVLRPRPLAPRDTDREREDSCSVHHRQHQYLRPLSPSARSKLTKTTDSHEGHISYRTDGVARRDVSSRHGVRLTWSAVDSVWSRRPRRCSRGAMARTDRAGRPASS